MTISKSQQKVTFLLKLLIRDLSMVRDTSVKIKDFKINGAANQLLMEYSSKMDIQKLYVQ